MKKMNSIDWIFLVLLIVGGLNWGLVGLFNFNVVTFVFGSGSIITTIIYILVGISAIYVAIALPMKSRNNSPTR